MFSDYFIYEGFFCFLFFFNLYVYEPFGTNLTRWLIYEYVTLLFSAETGFMNLQR